MGSRPAPTRVLEYVNAGHNPPMVFRPTSSGVEIFRLSTSGSILGVFPNLTFVKESFQLQEGDVLVIYSDGITEARNETGEFFEESGLTSLLPSLLGGSAEAIRDEIMKAVADFEGDGPQVDDITLMVAKIL